MPDSKTGPIKYTQTNKAKNVFGSAERQQLITTSMLPHRCTFSVWTKQTGSRSACLSFSFSHLPSICFLSSSLQVKPFISPIFQ